MLAGRNDNRQIPPCSGLADKAVPALSRTIGQMASKDNLLDLLHRDVVASDMVFAAWLNDKFKDPHKTASFVCNCITKEADLSRDQNLGVSRPVLKDHAPC